MIEQLSKEIKSSMIPKIEEFIKIPNSSRNFNPEWKNCPIQMQAVNFCVEYFKS